VKKIIGISFITFGLYMCLNDLSFEHNKKTVEDEKITSTFKDIVNYNHMDNIYTSILSIPKINLKKGIYDIDNPKNNIEENIMIDKHSVYPNNDKSNVILVAHSGVGKKAYFNRLKELDYDSLIEFYYDHTKYVYKLDNKYQFEKTGKVKLEYDKNKKTITLITCVDQDIQIVYIGYLIDEINY